MKRLPFLLLLVLIMIRLDAFAQDDKKQKEAAQAEVVKRLVESKSFVFQPESASPLKGGMVHLSPGYSVKVMPNSIDCDLPY